MWYRILGFVAGAIAWGSAAAQTPLPQAHAHNDYEHSRPLLDALDQGFCSVEADIWLVEGALLVAHDREDVRPDRTLEGLYLRPLQERARTLGGRIFPGATNFTLLIDLKSDAAGTYAVLEPLLRKYRELLTRFTDTNATPGAVTVILSGARPVDQVRTSPERWCGIDGRLPDLAANPSPFLVPLVSDNWRPTFPWFTEGALSAADRERLRELVRQAHSQGRQIRFWGVPDHESAWRELQEAGVDLINTDRLQELRRFLLGEAGTPGE